MGDVHNLRQWRKLKGYGQRELARLAGLSHTAVSDLEQGKTKGLPATWRKLAAVLGIDVTQILEYRRAVGLDEETGDGDEATR